MTGFTYRISCTECEWKGVIRIGRAGAETAAAEHKNETGHTVRIEAIDGDEEFLYGHDEDTD